jgi:hypothetical protein
MAEWTTGGGGDSGGCRSQGSGGGQKDYKVLRKEIHDVVAVLKDTMRSRGYRDAFCDLIIFAICFISFDGAIPWFSLEHGWNLVFDNLRTNRSARALVASFPYGSHQRFNDPCPSSSNSTSSFRGPFPPWA